MPVFSVTCNECRATLKSSKPIPPGKTITCPKCGVMFAAPKAAAPAPAVKKKIVEVMDDVEILEEDEVEIFDDEPTKTKAGGRPKVDEGARGRRRSGKPKRQRMSTTALILVLAGGVLGLGAFGLAGVLVWKYVLNAQSDLIAYVPADSGVVGGIDLGRVMNDTSLGPLVESLLGNVQQWRTYGQETQQGPKQFLDKWVITFAGVGEKGTMTLTCKSKIEQPKAVKAFNAKAPITVGGQEVFPFDATASSYRALFTPKTVSIFEKAASEDSIAQMGKCKPSDVMATMITKAAANHAWVVIDPASFIKTALAGMGAAMPALPNNASADEIKCIGVWVKVVDSDANVTLQIQMRNVPAKAPDVQKATADIKGQLTAFTPLVSAAYVTLFSELVSTIAVTTSGDCMIVKAKLKMATLTPIIQEAARESEYFKPPGSRR